MKPKQVRHNSPTKRKVTLRTDLTTYSHLKALAKAQHSSINALLITLINGNYHPRKQINVNPKDRKQILDKFLHVEDLISSLNNDISHDSANLNQIAFKVNTHDFKNKNPAYIANNSNSIKYFINQDNLTLGSSNLILTEIKKEMFKIWRLLI